MGNSFLIRCKLGEKRVERKLSNVQLGETVKYLSRQCPDTLSRS